MRFFREALPGKLTATLVRLIIFAAAAACLVACGPAAATVARMDGFDAQWRGFNTLKGDPTLYHEAEIKMKVIVVGDLADIGYPGAAATYSHPEGVIRIMGKKINGKIVLCPAVIGHEVQHALEYQDGNFANPDKLEEYGY
ncbi:MAG: hypothetical protein ACYC7J_16115 [Syntrophales bacterium]